MSVRKVLPENIGVDVGPRFLNNAFAVPYWILWSGKMSQIKRIFPDEL